MFLHGISIFQLISSRYSPQIAKVITPTAYSHRLAPPWPRVWRERGKFTFSDLARVVTLEIPHNELRTKRAQRNALHTQNLCNWNFGELFFVLFGKKHDPHFRNVDFSDLARVVALEIPYNKVRTKTEQRFAHAKSI